MTRYEWMEKFPKPQAVVSATDDIWKQNKRYNHIIEEESYMVAALFVFCQKENIKIYKNAVGFWLGSCSVNFWKEVPWSFCLLPFESFYYRNVALKTWEFCCSQNEQNYAYVCVFCDCVLVCIWVWARD